MSRLSPEFGDRAQVVLLSVCAILSAALEVLFVPLYLGSVVFPIVVVFAVVGNIVLPRLAFGLVPSPRAALAPFLSWLIVVLVLVFLPRPEGDVLVEGAGGQVYTFYGLLLGGAVAGTVTIVLLKGLTPPPAGTRPPPARRRPVVEPPRVEKAQPKKRPAPSHRVTR
jgi:hypothetical protein